MGTIEPFDYVVVASALHDAEDVDRLTAPVRSLLERLGGRREQPDWLPGDRPLVAVVATGGTERSLVSLARSAAARATPPPALLVAHGGHNSLPAALEALAALQQTGGRGRVVFLAGGADGSSDAAADAARLAEALVDLQAVERFRRTRLGLIGGASDWLVASSPTAETVRRRWGPRVEVLDPAPLRGPEVRDAGVGPTAERFAAAQRADRSTVTPVDVRAAGAVGDTLRRVTTEHDLTAVAVRCFDLLTEPGTSGCLGLATLNDDGIVAGCEGDLPSTLAMLLVRFLLDQPSWMANPARIDVDADEVLLAHCTVAPSLVEEMTLATHFESGIGVGISGRFAEHPVTLIRFGGRDLDRWWVADGRIVATGDDPDLCRTQATVEVDPSGGRSVRDLLERPLGNHLVLAAGHHAERIERWCEFAIADGQGSPTS